MNRDLIFIAVSLFLWGLGESAYFPLQTLYLEKLGASALQIGMAVGGFSLVGALSYIPGGYLADRFGRRPLIIAGWAIGIVATFLMALSDRLAFFVASMLFYGLTVFVLPPLNSYVTEARGKLSIGRALTLTSAFYSLGAIVGPLFGGKIADAYGFQRLYFIATGIYVISTIIVCLIRSQPPVSQARDAHEDQLMNNPKFISFLVVLFVAIFAMYLPQPLAANYLQNQQHLNLTSIGQLYSMNAFGIVVLNLVLGQLNARPGFLLGQIAVGIFSLILWQFSGMPWFMIAFLLLGGFRAAKSLAVAQVRDLVLPSRMGVAYGLAETFYAIAMILSPLLAGYLYENNPPWLFSVSLVAILFSVCLSYLFTQKQKADINIETT
ncbi:MAG: MFS transporter [Anaerolineales bacterium]|nr:MFS transporter [Anaerolineales bacterium]